MNNTSAISKLHCSGNHINGRGHGRGQDSGRNANNRGHRRGQGWGPNIGYGRGRVNQDNNSLTSLGSKSYSPQEWQSLTSAQHQEVYCQCERLATARIVAAVISESLVMSGQGDDMSAVMTPTGLGNNSGNSQGNTNQEINGNQVCKYPCSLGSNPVWEDKGQSNWWLLTC